MSIYSEDSTINELNSKGFFEELAKRINNEGCDSASLRLTEGLLEEMGYSDDSIDEICSHFKRKGGFCDCEIFMNVLP